MQALAPMGPLVFAPARAQALGPVRPPAAPSARTIQTTACVVEVFSCLLPQSSLGPVAVSISACRGSPHGSAYLGAIYVLSQFYGILPIYKPQTHSVKESCCLESHCFSANPQLPQRVCVILALRHASLILDRDNACACPGHL